MAKLTAKQAQFVEEYLIDLNATQAAIRAGYSANTAKSVGSENLTKPDIQEALAVRAADRAARTEITQDRVLKELARLAFLDIRKAFNDNGELKPIHELDDETAAAISGIEVSEITSGDNVIGNLKKIKLSDKKGSLELLGRHLQMWKDSLAVSGLPPIIAITRRIIG